MRISDWSSDVCSSDLGGHWVCNTGAAVQHVVRHPEIFSSRYLSIPPNPNQPKMIPEMLDPPEHRPYRQMLRPFFESKAIEPLEARSEEHTSELQSLMRN